MTRMVTILSLLTTSLTVQAGARTVHLTMPAKTFRVMTADGYPLANIGLRASVGAYDEKSVGCGGIPPTPGNPFDFVLGLFDKVGTSLGLCQSPVGIIGSAYDQNPRTDRLGPIFTTDKNGYVTIPRIDFVSSYSQPFIYIGLASYIFSFRASNSETYTCLNEGTFWPYNRNRIIDFNQGPLYWGDKVWVGDLQRAQLEKTARGHFIAVLDGRDEITIPRQQTWQYEKDKYGKSTIAYSSQALTVQALQKIIDSRIAGVESHLRDQYPTKDMSRLGCR